MGVLHLCVLLGTVIISDELQFSVTLSFLSSSHCGCELPCCLHQ